MGFSDRIEPGFNQAQHLEESANMSEEEKPATETRYDYGFIDSSSADSGEGESLR